MLPAPPSCLTSALTAPVAVLGEGISGQGVQALVGALDGTFVAYDATGKEFTAAAAAGHGLVVYSPGFPPDHPWLARARAAGCLALSELDFASLFWRGQVLAVTGTNGKTTLTEFLAHALPEAGRAAAAAGNIGHAFCRLVAATGGGLPELTAVCEVSSFQAESLQHLKAAATLWTNFAEDHLERHGDLPAYFAAKAALAMRSARVFAGSSVRAFAEKSGFVGTAAAAGFVWIETEGRPADPALEGTVFADYPQRENYLLAAAWWKAEGLNAAVLAKAAGSFRLGRHRLAPAAQIGGVTYWNDSKATNFHAVEAALARFHRPVLLIAGGRAKGGDLRGFIHRIASKVRQVYLIGETAPELGRACAAENLAHTFCGSLAAALSAAAEDAVPGDHVLLSPGFARFDMFRNYQDRGDQFEALLKDRSLAKASA